MRAGVLQPSTVDARELGANFLKQFAVLIEVESPLGIVPKGRWKGKGGTGSKLFGLAFEARPNMGVEKGIDVAVDREVDADTGRRHLDRFRQCGQILKELGALRRRKIQELANLRRGKEERVARQILGVAHHRVSARQLGDRGGIEPLFQGVKSFGGSHRLCLPGRGVESGCADNIGRQGLQ